MTLYDPDASATVGDVSSLRISLMQTRQRISELETLVDSLSKRVIQLEARSTLPERADGGSDG